MSANVLRVLKRVLVGDRDALVRQLIEQTARSEAVASPRQDEIEEAREAVRAWRAAELRLARLENEARKAGHADSHRLRAIEAALEAAPTPAMRRLDEFIERTAQAINRAPVPPGGLRRVGEALAAARVALRDEVWRLPSAEADGRGAELRQAIEDALMPAPEEETS